MAERREFTPEENDYLLKLVTISKLHPGDISQTARVALVFLDEGRRLLLDVGKFHQGRGSVLEAPDTDEFITSLKNPEVRMKAVMGVGMLLIGSLAYAIEDAKKDHFRNGWSDGVYSARFNENRVGTPVDRMPDNLKAGIPVLPNSYDETQKIKTLSALEDKQGTLAVFFQDVSKLPTVVRLHLFSFGPIIRYDAFGSTAALFAETNRRLATETTTLATTNYVGGQDLTSLQRENLNAVDALLYRLDHPTPALKLQVQEFLDQLSKP